MIDVKISVIIPVYNAAKFLARCLDSVLGQDYPHLEVICVNDGSKDESLSILHIYAQKDPRVKVLSQFNQGAAAARNKGLKAATGDYVSFVDADDYLSQGLYSYFAQAISNDEVDIFMFNGVVNQSDNFFTPRNFYHPVAECQNVTYKDFYGLFYGNSGVCNKIFKKSFLQEKKISFLAQNCFEDIDFWFKSLIQAQRVKVSFKSFYNYIFDNEDSVTKTFGLNSFCLFDTFNSMLNVAKKQGLEDFFQDALFQYQYEKSIETLFLMKPEFQEKFYYNAQEFLRRRIKQLKGDSYKNLLNFGNCYNLILNDYIDFKNSTLLFRDKFNYLTKKPQEIRFSVIVPVYNVEKYLNICLKSLINQTFQNFEIICVNDGSTDKSLDILNFYADKDVRIKIINQENKGLGAARNVGVAQAQGEYLVFVDSDDWLRSDALEILDRQMRENPVDVCLFGYNEFNENVMINVHMRILDTLKNKQMDVLDYMFVFVTAWSKIYNKQFWDAHQFKFQENVFFEDTLPNAQIFSKIKNLSICWQNLYYYRLSNESITRKMFTDKKIDDLFAVYEQTFSFLQEQKIYFKIQSAFVEKVKNVFNFYLNKIPEQKKVNYLNRFFEFLERISHV